MVFIGDDITDMRCCRNAGAAGMALFQLCDALVQCIFGTSIFPLFRGCPFFRGRNVYRQGANSLSIVGRLSTLRSALSAVPL